MNDNGKGLHGPEPAVDEFSSCRGRDDKWCGHDEVQQGFHAIQ